MTGVAGIGGAIIGIDTGGPDDTGGGTIGGIGGGAGGRGPGIGGGIMPGIGGGIDMEGIIIGGGGIMPIGIIGGIMPERLYKATTRLSSYTFTNLYTTNMAYKKYINFYHIFL